MVIAHLNDSERYASLHPLFKQLFDYVKSHDLSQVPAERITLDGERLFINVADPTLKDPENQVLEVHRRYIDVHFPPHWRRNHGLVAHECADNRECKSL